MFEVFRCSGLLTFWKVKRVTREGGGPKMTKIQCGDKTGHLLEGGPKMAKILGGVKFQHFGPPLWPKKVLQTAEKVGSAQN